MKRLTVLGFGLIGGSFALAQRRNGPVHVTAVDFPGVLGHPRTRAAADARLAPDDVEAVARALAAADLVLLATPVRAICESLPGVLASARLVTDTGSTKRDVLRAARACPANAQFVASHPMAGAPEDGIEHARAELFEGRRWFVCPDGADDTALTEVESWIAGTGAVAARLSAAAHDAAVARTSHLPQLVASALVQVVEAAGAGAAAGPALERLARTAGGPGAMWRDIFASNSDEVATAIRELVAVLTPIADELGDGGRTQAADRLLHAARRLRAELGAARVSPSDVGGARS